MGYERWIDKYKDFLVLLLKGPLPDPYDDEGKALLSVLKIMYLQNIKDEPLFCALFKETWKAEKQKWEVYFKTIIDEQTKPGQISTPGKAISENPIGPATNDTTAPARRSDIPVEQNNNVSVSDGNEVYFFTPPDIGALEKPAAVLETDSPVSAYNLQDEYLPISRLEMIKGWQYLRSPEKEGQTDKIDLPATVVKIAKENIFIEPDFLPGIKNKKGSLLLFVDCNGSMMPYHELSRRLIKTAQTMVGTSSTSVYYFHDSPTDFVFQSFLLTGPTKLKSVFLNGGLNSNSLAVIISDAGFAKDYGVPGHYEKKIELLKPFLDLVNSYCANILWLNPLPRNRWELNMTDFIKQNVLKMSSVFEAGINPFQDTIRTLLKQNSIKA